MSTNIECSACGESFTRRSSLKRHIRGRCPGISTDESSYVCACGKVFRSKEALGTHRYRVHDEHSRRRVQCRHCLRDFASGRSYLMQHEATCEGKLRERRMHLWRSKGSPGSDLDSSKYLRGAHPVSTTQRSRQELELKYILEGRCFDLVSPLRDLDSTQATDVRQPLRFGPIDIHPGEPTLADILSDLANRLDRYKRPSRGNVVDSSLETTAMLLDRGAELDWTGLDGETPLHVAAAFGDLRLMNALLARGADINAQDKWEETPLLTAISCQQEDISMALIDHGADLEAEDDDEWRPLHHSACHGLECVLKALLDCKAGINPQIKGGCSALMLTSGRGHESCVRQLLDAGADIHLSNYGGWQALHYAAWHGRCTVTSMLLGAGAEVDATDARGDTPLIFALMWKRIETSRILIRAGARMERSMFRHWRDGIYPQDDEIWNLWHDREAIAAESLPFPVNYGNSTVEERRLRAANRSAGTNDNVRSPLVISSDADSGDESE